jgi:hypothetical protein
MTEQELAELDLAVARVEGIEAEISMSRGIPLVPMCCVRKPFFRLYQPSRDPVEAMRLLEKHRLMLEPVYKEAGWHCYWPQDGGVEGYGETPCIAICRAVVTLW